MWNGSYTVYRFFICFNRLKCKKVLKNWFKLQSNFSYFDIIFCLLFVWMMLFLCNKMEWELTDMDNWITIVKMSKLLESLFRNLESKSWLGWVEGWCLLWIIWIITAIAMLFYDNSCDDSHYSPGSSFSSINYCLRCLISSITLFLRYC